MCRRPARFCPRLWFKSSIYNVRGFQKRGSINLRLDSEACLDMMKIVFTLHPAGERSRLPAWEDLRYRKVSWLVRRRRLCRDCSGWTFGTSEQNHFLGVRIGNKNWFFYAPGKRNACYPCDCYPGIYMEFLKRDCSSPLVEKRKHARCNDWFALALNKHSVYLTLLSLSFRNKLS